MKRMRIPNMRAIIDGLDAADSRLRRPSEEAVAIVVAMERMFGGGR